MARRPRRPRRIGRIVLWLVLAPALACAVVATLIGEFYVERRYLVPLDHIPQHVRLAFLAAEDADFYRHRGVDPLSIARAFLTNLLHHEVVQGGSTITQ